MGLGEHLGTHESQARGVGLDEEEGDAAGARARVGRRENAVEVRLPGIGDQVLAAVEHPIPAIAHGAGGDARHVRAGSGLGHGEGRHLAASHHLGQDPPAQLLRSRQHDRHGAQALQGEDRIGQGRGIGQSLAGQAAGPQVRTLPAGIHIGVGVARQAGLAEQAEDLPRLAAGRGVVVGGLEPGHGRRHRRGLLHHRAVVIGE
ncbi:MAG: hypothetical protein MI919_41610 [Holophagales bacterium]|nr:hypothetical protein [Holophagales bacterium]